MLDPEIDNGVVVTDTVTETESCETDSSITEIQTETSYSAETGSAVMDTETSYTEAGYESSTPYAVTVPAKTEAPSGNGGSSGEKTVITQGRSEITLQPVTEETDVQTIVPVTEPVVTVPADTEKVTTENAGEFPTPTLWPTVEPTRPPTVVPTIAPTRLPTVNPTQILDPTTDPTRLPTVEPTMVRPTTEPTATIPCVIYYEYEDYSHSFIKELDLSNAEDEYEARQALRKEYEANGKFSDEELEQKRQEYCNSKIKDRICKLLEDVIDPKETKMSISTYKSAYLLKEHREQVEIELTFSDEQFTAAQKELKPSAFIITGNEKEKFGLKIRSFDLLNEIRDGKDLHGVKLLIPGEYAGKTDDELEKFVKENLDITEFISVAQSYEPTLGADYPCSVNVSATTEQIEAMCQTDYVQSIMPCDLLPKPTAEPINTATAEPTIIPFDPGTPMPTHTPAPASPLPTNQNGAIYGDLNDDKVVDISDLTMLSLVLIGDVDLTDYMKSVADFDGDSTVTIADLARLRQYLSKKIDTLYEQKETEYSFTPISVRVTVDHSIDEYPQHQIITDRAGFEALFTEKQELEIEESGGKLAKLNGKYTDEWFETHKLYVAYPGIGGPTSTRYKVEKVTNKEVTIYQNLLGQSMSPTEELADWIIFIEVSRDADVTEATEIKFNTVY